MKGSRNYDKNYSDQSNKFYTAIRELVTYVNKNDINIIQKGISAEILSILRKNSIGIDSVNQIFQGGKKSRKTRKTKKKLRRRKQKGGYQYDEKSKRRRFTTSAPKSSSKSRTSRTTSKTSSLYKDKARTRKTL